MARLGGLNLCQQPVSDRFNRRLLGAVLALNQVIGLTRVDSEIKGANQFSSAQILFDKGQNPECNSVAIERGLQHQVGVGLPAVNSG